MPFGKTKKEICAAWAEVGQAAFLCYTTLCAMRINETGACEKFKWSELADTLGMKKSAISNYKKILFDKRWISEIDGLIYPVKGFESELAAIGVDCKKFTSDELFTSKSSRQMNSESEKFTSDELSEAKSSRQMNFQTEKSSSDVNFSENDDEKSSRQMNKKFTSDELSGALIRNTEITELKTDQTNPTLETPREREDGFASVDSVGSAENDFEFWAQKYLARDENGKIVLTDEENRMRDADFYEHLARLNPHLGGLKQIQIRVGELMASRTNPKRIWIKRWICAQSADLAPPPVIPATESPPADAAHRQAELEAKLLRQKQQAKDFYGNNGRSRREKL